MDYTDKADGQTGRHRNRFDASTSVSLFMSAGKTYSVQVREHSTCCHTASSDCRQNILLDMRERRGAGSSCDFPLCPTQESHGAIPAQRGYLLLNVDAVTADDDDAVVPVVKYVFGTPPPQPH